MTDEQLKARLQVIPEFLQTAGEWAASAYMPYAEDEEPFHSLAVALRAMLENAPDADEAWKTALYNVGVYRARATHDAAWRDALAYAVSTQNLSHPTQPREGFTKEQMDAAEERYKALRYHSKPDAEYIVTRKEESDSD